MAAKANLRDAARSVLRRRRREAVLAELCQSAIPESRPPYWHLLRVLLRACRTPEELAFVRARLRGERSASVLASLLGHGDASEEEQRAIVHRAEARIRLRCLRELARRKKR
jgi:hypothetical protein